MRRAAVLAAAILSTMALPSLAQTKAAAPAASASAPVSPAKRQLVQKMLNLLQPGTEAMARSLVEQPLQPLMQQVGAIMRGTVPEDKREAVSKDIQADMKKYVDESYPIARDRAMKLAPGIIGPMLEERFSEDELKQLVAWLESPLVRKYQQITPEIQKAVAEQLVADTRGTIEPKLRALHKSVGDRLGLSPTEPPPSMPGAAPAPVPGPGKKAIPPAPKSSAARQ